MIIEVTETQFHAMLLPAIHYGQAICVRNADIDRLRRLCARYGEQIELVGSSPDDYEAVLARAMNPMLRQRAIIIPHRTNIPHELLSHLIQVRLI